jgi:hypothetical protein
MQLALRPYAISGVAVLSAAAVGAGLIAVTSMAPSPPDIPVRSSDMQLASVADIATSGLGGSIDAGLNQLESYVDEGIISLGYAEYGLLSELSTGLDNAGATALGADLLTLADDAIDTQITVAPINSLFTELETLINDIFPSTDGSAGAEAASLVADSTPTTLGGLIDAGLTQLESYVDDSVVALGYAEYGLLSELSTGLDDAGLTTLGADALTLADDAIDTQITVAPITELFTGLETLVGDLGLNSIPF